MRQLDLASFPAITDGSPKQNDWATSVRAETVHLMERAMDAIEAGIPRMSPAGAALVESIPDVVERIYRDCLDCNFWIAARRTTVEECAITLMFLAGLTMRDASRARECAFPIASRPIPWFLTNVWGRLYPDDQMSWWKQ